MRIFRFFRNAAQEQKNHSENEKCFEKRYKAVLSASVSRPASSRIGAIRFHSFNADADFSSNSSSGGSSEAGGNEE